jgi:serine/threonine protein kinase
VADPAQTMSGERLGHYLVLSELGRGGMGVVYLAQDTRLDRRVALKVLRPEVADASDRRARFQQEARAAAALNHPNIVHLYSVEQLDALLFITMEFVSGRSLHSLLTSRTPLALPIAVGFATQLAEGLASAHAAGILHRDLKPGNVMITDDDRVKILDFGLAKLVGPLSTTGPDAATIAGVESSSGTTVGTLGYMSPEQALGRRLDPRSDLFALGVVLFQMATGCPPFEGETPAAVFDQLLNRHPPTARTLNAAIPPLLEAVIHKAIEKDPDRRYRSAGELLQDLRGATSSSASVAQPISVAIEQRMPSSIVVLPFVDMSPENDQEYFCHGITEEIISTLTRVPGLRVISRTSAFAVQGDHLDVTEIGRRLRVGTALEGSVRKAGDRLRVTAQLVNAVDGYQLWSMRFDRELADVFAIQDEVAASIVHELRMGLARVPVEKRRAANLAAHDAYLRGMYALNRWTDQSMERAIGDFRDAIARDPDFAPSYAALAEAHIWLYAGLGIRPASATVPEARSAVEKALTLDATLADAHRVRALIAMNHDWDRKGTSDGPGARTGIGARSSLERLAAGAVRTTVRPGVAGAGRGRAAGPARSSAEDADRLCPFVPSRSRSRHRAIRPRGGAGTDLCVCALCLG